MRVYVASFSPADARAAIGGFEWRRDFTEAATVLRNWLDGDVAAPEAIHNLALVILDVPDGLVTSAVNDEVTAWINDHLDLIEPAGNHGKEATVMKE